MPREEEESRTGFQERKGMDESRSSIRKIGIQKRPGEESRRGAQQRSPGEAARSSKKQPEAARSSQE